MTSRNSLREMYHVTALFEAATAEYTMATPKPEADRTVVETRLRIALLRADYIGHTAP
jgi:hypothetical protein